MNYSEEQVEDYSNHDVSNVCTPIQADMLEQLLKKTNYDVKESSFLIKGFRTGFSIGYKGPMKRQDKSDNIPFTPGVGDKFEMWKKIMKEVKLKRYAGPFTEVPFTHYVQSPIGLVPKAGGQTRLIFHLSYKFKNGNESVNFWTPKEKCSVHYNNINHAVNNCLWQLREMRQHNGERRNGFQPVVRV